MPDSRAASLPTILLSVAGLSPQVITETLYCLIARSDPPIDVREIRAVTTRAGAARIQEQLLHPAAGWFHRFCRDYGIPPRRIRFDPSCILVPAAATGDPLEDVRTPEDNAAVADAVLSLVRDLTRDPATALHCSVAGGRKTMGLFLGIAFQLFARPQDRLSHVLVWPPELEGHHEFFYPTPRPAAFRVNGHPIRGRDIRVELAEIPVLLLREKVHAAGLEHRSYRALVAQGQQELDRLTTPPPLILDPPSRSLRVGDQAVPLTPLEFAVYSLFARRRRHGCGDSTCGGCPTCALEAKALLDTTILDQMRKCLADLGIRDERTRSLSGWGSAGHERFLEVRSKINSKIRRALGAGRWVEPYCIRANRTPGAPSRYSILLDPTQIVLG